MTRDVIIICAGDATRWGNYMDTPKHFAVLDGEPILNRTIRQIKSHGVNKISIVAKTKDYEKAGAPVYIPTFTPEMRDADKFYSSKPLWNKEGRTIVLYGDVYFTDEAMNTIMGWPSPEWTLFGRAGESKVTGTPYGECFAQSFYPESHDEHYASLRRIARLWDWGLIYRCGGWEHYRSMIGIPDEEMKKHVVKDHFVEINDWTDDFDYPSDYDRWVKLRRKAGFKEEMFKKVK